MLLLLLHQHVSTKVAGVVVEEVAGVEEVEVEAVVVEELRQLDRTS